MAAVEPRGWSPDGTATGQRAARQKRLVEEWFPAATPLEAAGPVPATSCARCWGRGLVFVPVAELMVPEVCPPCMGTGWA